MAIKPVSAIALLLIVALSGCLTAYDEFEHFDSDAEYHNPGVFAGAYLLGDKDRALPLQIGSLQEPMHPDRVILESKRPATGAVLGKATGAPNGVTGFGEEDESKTSIVMAIWHPQNYTAKRPIIVTSIVEETKDKLFTNATQSTPLLLQGFLPQGYSVVQIAVRGTGPSGGCVDLLGDDETADLDQALTWLGEQEWSNGRIGMMGVGYDGATAWAAAGTGNPYLKTIVPMSGFPSVYDVLVRNGTATTGTASMHGMDGYWANGFSEQFPQERPEYRRARSLAGALGVDVPGWPVLPDDAPRGNAVHRADYQDRQNLMCPAAIEGQAAGQVTAREGSRMEDATAYWAQRDHRQRVLDNYEGSIFLTHGLLQSEGVDPHSAIPFNVRLREAGFEMKEWYGQWGVEAPDGQCGLTRQASPAWLIAPCRMDFAEVLSRWFEKYLRGNQSVDTGPPVQVQDNIGVWRNIDAFPPTDVKWAEFQVGMDGVLGSDDTGDVLLPSPEGVGDVRALKVTSAPFPDGVHISGMPQVKVPFSVQEEGGFVSAWLFDVSPDNKVRLPTFTGNGFARWVPDGFPVIGHAQMNLRFFDGGEERQTLVPGQRYVAHIEMEPMDAHIPPGHRLMLWLVQMPFPDHTASGTPSDVVVHLDGDATLRLPVEKIDPRDTFAVPGVMFPNSPYIPAMYASPPRIPDAEPARFSIATAHATEVDAQPNAPEGAAASGNGTASSKAASGHGTAYGEYSSTDVTACAGCLP